MNRGAAIAEHRRSCGGSVTKSNILDGPLFQPRTPKLQPNTNPPMKTSEVLLANMSQKQLKALHREAIRTGDQGAAASISKYMLVDQPPQSGCLYCSGCGDYPTKRSIEFVCGRCVVLLSEMSQGDLKTAYRMALDSIQTRKAGAIRKFIKGETTNERTKKKHQRPTERKSPLRMAGIGSP